MISASRCVAIFETNIAENVSHGSTNKSFISNLVTSKVVPKASSFKQQATKIDPETPIFPEQDDVVEQASPKLYNSVVVGCKILVPVVDTNVKIATVAEPDEDDPIKDGDNMILAKDDDCYPATVMSMKGPSSTDQQSGLFCSWEDQEKSIIASRRKKSNLKCNQDMMRLKKRLHNLQQQQQPQRPQNNDNLDETATWL